MVWSRCETRRIKETYIDMKSDLYKRSTDPPAYFRDNSTSYLRDDSTRADVHIKLD